MSAIQILEERIALLESKLAGLALATVARDSDHEGPKYQTVVTIPPPAAERSVKPPAGGGIADPGPLGLFAFAICTIMLNFKNASITEAASMGLIVSYGIVYGGFIQLIAGLLEFKKQNIFGATVFSSYGGFWIGLAIWDILAAAKIFPGGTAFPAGRAVWLSVWGFFSFLLIFATFRMNRVMQVTITSVALLFFLLAGGVYSETSEILAGVVGIFAGFSAMYLGYATFLKHIYGREVLPVWNCS
ncbi:hypothetical protein HK102_000183 [Quaeritorhiza haematococci]|nr:hypothetical protein HK102_000183 [Quaeritorhiza haematococci]